MLVLVICDLDAGALLSHPFVAGHAEHLGRPRCRAVPPFGRARGPVYVSVTAVSVEASSVDDVLHRFQKYPQPVVVPMYILLTGAFTRCARMASPSRALREVMVLGWVGWPGA